MTILQILVVDDDVELCELVAEYLEPDGYKVEAVHDGETGLERARSGDHALAVLDYMLPGLNGFELLKQIRHRTRTVKRDGETVELTLVEYSILEKLLNAAGTIVKREELVRDVLHRALSPFDRSMDTHVANLRRKLGHQVEGVERIKTVRGIGYIYATPSTTKP